MRRIVCALFAVSCFATSSTACRGPSVADPAHPGGPAESPASPKSVAPAEGTGPAAPADAPAPSSPASAASDTRIEGCLAAAEATEAAASEFPARGQSRSAARKTVTVTPKAGGLTVKHALDHACCLKGEVDTSIGDGTVEIVEQLSGQPCRCLCSSTLETEVALSAGEWDVVVIVQRYDGTRDEVHREKVTTPSRE